MICSTLMYTPSTAGRVVDLWTRARRAVAMRLGRYEPYLPQVIDDGRLRSDLGRYLGLPAATIAAWWDEYAALSRAQGYAARMGERKTLCFEEAFILFALMRRYRPPTVVEIGTQYGRSTRRIIDMRRHLGLASRVVCFDVVDQVRFFEPSEAELVLRDVTDDVAATVLHAYPAGLIYLDAHPYALLQDVVRAVLADGRWALAIHDCAAGLCNPRMTLPRDEPEVTSRSGVWERHVLADIFGVPDPLSARLDDLETASHRLRVFGTPHGLAVILPRQLAPAPDPAAD
ncbi:hypothetical protein DCC79_08940 [bacterium]|nr:hypothetical protein [Chloroflexi bacterium CFX6]RIL10136.1 MAG: hypothetical protein DCC79_08940 [bacterium]